MDQMITCGKGVTHCDEPTSTEHFCFVSFLTFSYEFFQATAIVTKKKDILPLINFKPQIKTIRKTF